MRKLGDSDCRERFRIELRNIFVVLEGMEDGEDFHTMWDQFKTAYNEPAKVTLEKEM